MGSPQLIPDPYSHSFGRPFSTASSQHPLLLEACQANTSDWRRAIANFIWADSFFVTISIPCFQWLEHCFIPIPWLGLVHIVAHDTREATFLLIQLFHSSQTMDPQMDLDNTEPRGTKRSAEDNEEPQRPKRIRVSSHFQSYLRLGINAT